MGSDLRTLAPAAAAVAVLVALAASGCVSKAALIPRVFTIDPPAARAVRVPGGVVLSLRRVTVAPAYAGASLVYKVGSHGIERDPYARFASSPGSQLTTAIRGYLGNAGFVRDVVADGDDPQAQARVEVSVDEIVADLRDPVPSSILTLRFRVMPESAVPTANPAILLKTYSKRMPLSRRSAPSVVEGWNKALEGIMTDFLADLESSLVRERDSS